jgi:hypothetical protein
MNVLHSPLATVHVDRYPLLSPAIWIGECWKNGTSTDRGWTQPKLKAFLAFLDTVGVQSIALWCMAEMGCPHIKSGNLSKGEVYCPWMYEEIRAWRHRPAANATARANQRVAVAGEGHGEDGSNR